MYLDNVSLAKWNARKEVVFKKKSHLSARFEENNKIFDWILNGSNTISIAEDEVKIGDISIKIYPDKNPNHEMFGAALDEMTEDRKLDGILKQIESLTLSEKDFPKNLLLMMGGFDFNDPHAVKNKYRILSSSLISFDYDGSVTSSGQSAWVNSHFSDNTYFFHFMKFVQNCKKDEESQDINIALVYPQDRQKKGRISKIDMSGLTLIESNLHDEKEAQRKLLQKRFPYKFLWMWANKDTVLHPFSLMAFRNFVNSKFMEDILKAQKIKAKELIDMEFRDFTDAWTIISKEVTKKQNVDISELSKLISILMVEETDMSNASDLLKTTKQIILYGAPGTGKTFTAMNIVKDFIVCNSKALKETIMDDDFENEHRFCKKFLEVNLGSEQINIDIGTLKNGLYEIVQFHPNYTYQDFIGGISPKIENDKIGYELKEGVFQRFCKVAACNTECDFVFIIDEINRANLSEVFGELLYALEYRGKAVNIPYFGEFIIPENIYIIGTMNDVDKSLVTFDLALRRRFGFFRLDPDIDALDGMFIFNEGTLIEESILAQYIDRCKELNKKIIDIKELALESNYQIGQAYFKKIESFLQKENDQIVTPFELEKLWIYHVEPLLQEYLGMSLESREIKTKLDAIKKEFTKAFN